MPKAKVAKKPVKSKWTTAELSDKVIDLTSRMDGIENTVTEVKSTANRIMDRLDLVCPVPTTTTTVTPAASTSTQAAGGGKVTTRSHRYTLRTSRPGHTCE